ncbi:MAG: flavodoxin family protein [Thermodesulfobacteriota bacterium]|nr:flavodoxin family protein [Thermodesulfobacteriota bacterium]
MRSLVVYSSQTGNTRKLAETVYRALTGEKKICPISDALDPSDWDFIAMGFWLKAGKPDPMSLEYLPRIKGKSLFLFATHGAAGGSEHALNAMNYAKELAFKAKVVGSYSCQGEVDPKIIEHAQAKPKPPVWIVDAPAAVGHPDETDIEELKSLIVSLTAV